MLNFTGQLKGTSIAQTIVSCNDTPWAPIDAHGENRATDLQRPLVQQHETQLLQ